MRKKSERVFQCIIWVEVELQMKMQNIQSGKTKLVGYNQHIFQRGIYSLKCKAEKTRNYTESLKRLKLEVYTKLGLKSSQSPALMGAEQQVQENPAISRALSLET